MLPFIAAATVLAVNYILIASLHRHGHNIDRWMFLSFGLNLHGLYSEHIPHPSFGSTVSDISVLVFGMPPACVIPASKKAVEAYFGSTLALFFLPRDVPFVSLWAQFDDDALEAGTNGTIELPPGFGIVNGALVATNFASDVDLWLNGHPANLVEPSVEVDGGLFTAKSPDMGSGSNIEATKAPVKRDVCIVDSQDITEPAVDAITEAGGRLLTMECPANSSSGIGGDAMLTGPHIRVDFGFDSAQPAKGPSVSLDTVLDVSAASKFSFGLSSNISNTPATAETPVKLDADVCDISEVTKFSVDIDVDTPAATTGPSVDSSNCESSPGAHTATYMRVIQVLATLFGIFYIARIFLTGTIGLFLALLFEVISQANDSASDLDPALIPLPDDDDDLLSSNDSLPAVTGTASPTGSKQNLKDVPVLPLTKIYAEADAGVSEGTDATMSHSVSCDFAELAPSPVNPSFEGLPCLI